MMNGRQTQQAVVIEDRFLRKAKCNTSVDEGCILKIDGHTLDVSKWARAHPGGRRILQKFNGKDATKAFQAAGHSNDARAMLKDFRVGSLASSSSPSPSSSKLSILHRSNSNSRIAHLVRKLFTKEDNWGLHKSLGLFSLCHFAYRFYFLIFGDDRSAGFGGNIGSKDGHTDSMAMYCLVPHALLSCSSLIFHIEKERVVGKPMIWQEFRAHNIIFGMRSIICSFLAWLSIYHHHQPAWRNFSVCTSCLTVLASSWAADYATEKLRHDPLESTTATMPYWKQCGATTQYIFKYIYALSQFGATMVCLHVSNPSWPFAVLLPIQGASFLMTLVRKGIISTYSYHVFYMASLLLVTAAGIRHIIACISHKQYSVSLDLVVSYVLAFTAYQLRRCGVDKFKIWIPIIACRLAVGDDYIHWKIW